MIDLENVKSLLSSVKKSNLKNKKYVFNNEESKLCLTNILLYIIYICLIDINLLTRY